MTINKKEIAQVSTKYILIALQYAWKWFVQYLKWGVKNPLKFILIGFGAFLAVCLYNSNANYQAKLNAMTPEQRQAWDAELVRKQAAEDAKQAKEAQERKERDRLEALQDQREELAEDAMFCAGIYGGISEVAKAYGGQQLSRAALDTIGLGAQFYGIAKSLDNNVNPDDQMQLGMRMIRDYAREGDMRSIQSEMSICQQTSAELVEFKQAQ